MKKILITGAYSYIGSSVENWLLESGDTYQITTLDMRHDTWLDEDFSRYDAVFHVAGIAHFSKDEKQKELYYKVNTLLTEEVAEKAKTQGVKQFIFMSSIIVYGDSSNSKLVITKDTIPSPSDFYGDSKLQAEHKLDKLADETFKVAIIRPPMIYGKGSKGNYPRLSKLAQKTFIFPEFLNERSMLHIDNLCEFIKKIIDLELFGVFFPQNKEYICTSKLVAEIAKHHGKTVYLTRSFNYLIPLFFRFDTIKKLFGNLVYEQGMSQYDFDYQIREFKESIERTEIEWKI